MNPVFAAMVTQFSQLTAGVHNSLYNAMPDRMYMGKAPQYPVYPYCVFMLVSGTPEDTFTEKFADCLVEFMLVTNDDSAINIGACFEYLKALYDDCKLPIAGNAYAPVYMQRESWHLLRDDEQEGGFWQYIVDYRILVQEL